MAFGVDITKQPFKSIYIGLSLLKLCLLRIPSWMLRYILPSLRPRKTWSYIDTIMFKLTKFFWLLDGRVGRGILWSQSHKALEVGKGVEGLYVEGVPELVRGDLKEWADFAGVGAVRIPGYWLRKPGTRVAMGEKAGQNEKVLYYFHGGAYVAYTAHPSCFMADIPRSIIARTPSVRRSFAIEYRLASPGMNPFPSQLLDALAGYNYLVNSVGFLPENIILVGDSAGANLALALTRYLVVNYYTIKSLHAPPSGLRAPPGGLVLLSPWCDVTGSHVVPGSSYCTLASSDIIPPPPLRSPEYEATVFAGPHGVDILKNEYISPAYKYKKLAGASLFKYFPPAFISVGDSEILFDSIVTLQERMLEDMGENKVQMLVTEDAFHDFIAFKWFKPHRTKPLEAIASWIERL